MKERQIKKEFGGRQIKKNLCGKCDAGKEKHKHVLGMFFKFRASWPYRKVTFLKAPTKIKQTPGWSVKMLQEVYFQGFWDLAGLLPGAF